MKANDKRQNVANAFQNLFPTTPGERELTGALRIVKRELIVPIAQPRTQFPAEELQSLADNIREGKEAGRGVGGTGILQPLLVRSAPDGKTYTLIAGERRWRASEIAGCTEVPVVVVSADDESAWEMALVENIQRQALSPLDEGEAIHHLMQLQHLSIREAAKKLGKDRGYLENRLALRRAGADIQEMVSLRNDTLMQAKLIDKVKEPLLRAELIRATIEDNAPISLIQKRIEEANGSADSPTQAPSSVSLRNDTGGEQKSKKHSKSKGDLFERALRPANELLGSALRELQQTPFSDSQRQQARTEIAALKAHIEHLEAALGQE